MSNISIFLDMAVKHVHLYPYRGLISNIGVCKKLKAVIWTCTLYGAEYVGKIQYSVLILWDQNISLLSSDCLFNVARWHNM
jgi:hypothetical protein